jgi:hypothetical protein
MDTNETYYEWTCYGTTNKNTNIEFNIKSYSFSISCARNLLSENIVNISRYGIPCFLITNSEKETELRHHNECNKIPNSEYVEVTLDILDVINNHQPEIVINVLPNLNVNAIPFIPTNIPTDIPKGYTYNSDVIYGMGNTEIYKPYKSQPRQLYKPPQYNNRIPYGRQRRNNKYDENITSYSDITKHNVVSNYSSKYPTYSTYHTY